MNRSQRVSSTDKTKSKISIQEIDKSFNSFLEAVAPDYQRSDEADKILNFVFRSLILGEEQKKSFIIHGPTGTGKTLLLQLIIKYLQGLLKDKFQFERDVKIVYIPTYDVLSTFRSYPDTEREGYLQRLKGIKFLAIDDIGTEETLNIYGDKRNLIQEILYARYDNSFSGRSTFLTTNLNLKQLSTHYGERIVSRLVEMCEWDQTALTGSDRRFSDSPRVPLLSVSEHKLSPRLA